MWAVSNIIGGFPYAERHCPYCSQSLELKAALHIQNAEEHYKAVFYCENKKCEAFDEEAKVNYARVYYSSEEAYHQLELIRIWMPARERR